MNKKEQNTIGFTLPAKLARYTPLADGAISFTFHSQKEILNNEELITVFNMNRKEGWLLFKPNPVQDDELPATPTKIEGKTPSQKLRAVLWLLWKQNKPGMDFPEYYEKFMERIISHYQLKLEE